jgi:hypothetical protein
MVLGGVCVCACVCVCTFSRVNEIFNVSQFSNWKTFIENGCDVDEVDGWGLFVGFL